MLRRRTPLKQSKGLERRARINKVGRVGRYRRDRKEQWIHDHPPDHAGYYICHICLQPVHVSAMKLDHVLPKGSTPKAIAERDDNLKPAHDWCNNMKGSTHG